MAKDSSYILIGIGQNARICTNISISDPKKMAFPPLPKQGRFKMLEQHQEEKEIKQWKESDDETLTLPNWK